MGKYEATSKQGHWIPSTKARAWFYSIGVAAAPIAIYYGIVTEEEAGLWISFAGTALGVTNALSLANLGERGTE